MDTEQEKSFERITNFLDTLTERLGRMNTDDDTDGEEGKASPKGAAQRIARVILAAEK